MRRFEDDTATSTRSHVTRWRATRFLIAHLVPALLLLVLTAGPAFAHGVSAGDKGYIQETFGVRIVPFLYLGVEDHADYHRPGDDAEKIDAAFYRGAVDFAYALLRAVDGAVDTFPARKP